jgi:hypothetical protein
MQEHLEQLESLLQFNQGDAVAPDLLSIFTSQAAAPIEK